MKLKVFIILCLLAPNIGAAGTALDELRKTFHESVLNPEQLPDFLSVVEAIDLPSPLEKAYIGASEALLARNVWNPILKMTHLNKFRNLLEAALEEDSNNLEIRFLRYSIEFNIPKFLRSEENMTEDKIVIMNNIDQMENLEIDSGFIVYILTLFEDTKTCTYEEIESIKRKLLH